MAYDDGLIDTCGTGRHTPMAYDDGSIDTCGTGRHTPPPTYQNLSLRNGFKAYTTDLKLDQINDNTNGIQKSTAKICLMMDERYGVPKTLKRIQHLMEYQDGINNTLIPILTFIIITQLLLCFINLIILPYSSTSRLEELKAVENLNLSEENMEIILNFAKRHVLLDLRNCISQYL